MKIYFRHVKMHIKRMMEYRASFTLMMISQFFTPFVSAAGIYFLFERFGTLGSWEFQQVLLCFSVTFAAFGFAECFARGFDRFSREIRTGSFDRILLRPRSAALLTACADFDITRLGKAIFAGGLLIYSALNSGISWTAMKLITLLMMVLGGTLTFCALFVINAALCFVTIEGTEIMNIFTNGGSELASYPLDIYPMEVTRFFTFIVPFGAANFVPLLFLLDKAQLINAFAPLLALPFFAASLILFNIGVRKYRSVGS